MPDKRRTDRAKRLIVSGVEIAAENVPPEIPAEDHATGLAAPLENLARFTET
jgi:hypothetical protein